MTKVKYIRAEVEVSDAHTQQICVAEWEMPILAAKHPRIESGPRIVEEVWIERDPPDTRGEYVRLENRYGRTMNEDGSKGAPWVAAVYGGMVAGQGGGNLAKAIKAATLEVDSTWLDDLGLGRPPEPAVSQAVSSVGG